MKKFLCILMSLLVLCPLALMQEEPQPAQELMDLLSHEKYEELFARSSKPMQEALASAKGYQQIWDGFVLQYGPFESLTVGESVPQEEYQVYRVDCYFERARLTLGMALDQEQLLSGLFVQSVEEAGLLEEDLLEGEEELLLRPEEPDETKGLLLLPKGEGPFPAVILIQGSGPSDRDESVFGMKPFKDLAQGLQKQGIASFRYDKYTYAHGKNLSKDQALRLTMREEYLLDALAAVRLLGQDERVGKIFLLGHSQGGQAAIRAAGELPPGSLSGLILLCATPYSITRLYVRQVRVALLQQDMEPAKREEALTTLASEEERLKTLMDTPDEDLLEAVFFNTFPALYLKDELAVNYQDLLLKAQLPLLIVQGGKDFQVKKEEGLLAWQEVLPQDADAVFQTYDNMTHLLYNLETASLGNASDYVPPRPVSNTLIDDLAQWVLTK